MMLRLFIALCFGVFSIAHAQITFEEAGEAARKVEIPNFADLITQDKINNTLPPTSFGDTSGLSNLRGDDGMGDIKTPGLNKAIACDTKNDPECLAIQMLRYGSANNPKFDESTQTQIKGEYSTTIGNKDGILGDLANLGSKERVCETVETVIPGQSATEVCDITIASNATQGMCEEGWEESKSLLVYYQCTMKALETDSSCNVITTPITHMEDIYQCTDHAATYADSTCTVTTTPVTHYEDIYQCTDRAAVMADNVCMVTTSAITHDQDIYQCTDRKDAFQDNACVVTTTPITHTEDIYQCIDRSAVYQDNACVVTTTAVTHNEDIYQCTDRKDVFVENACTVTTTPITHTEDIYQCTDRSATYETRTCDVPATVTVNKTYPYTCPITMAEATKKRCVKTLEVITTPTCNGGAGQDISLSVKTFKDYGWTADPWERSFKAHMSCGTSLTDFTLTIQSSIYNGTVTSAPFTTRSTSYGLDFIISFRVFEKDYMPHWEVSVTNIDAGLGSITLVDSIPFRLINHQERDVWTETCEEIP